MSQENAFNFKNAIPKTIKVADIRENTNVLRPVDKEDPEYIQLRSSIEAIGIGKSILVRELKDPVTGQEVYGLIDGLQRYNCAMDLGLTEIPALVGSMDEGSLIEAQIIMNLVHVKTKPSQFTEGILSMLRSDPFLTEAELAVRLSCSVKFLQERLSLKNLVPEAKPSLDDGTLPLMNAYALAKLKPEQQTDLLSQAKAKDATEFVPIAHQLFKNNKEARQKGTKVSEEFVPIPRLHRLTTLNETYQQIEKNPDASPLIVAMKANGVTTVEDAVKYTLNFVRHLDPVTVAADKAKREADKAAAKAEKEKKKQAEEAAKKAKENSVAVAFK